MPSIEEKKKTNKVEDGKVAKIVPPVVNSILIPTINTNHIQPPPIPDFTIIDKKDKEDNNAVASENFAEYEEEEDSQKTIMANKGKKVLTEAELDQKIYITLSETPTSFLFFSPSTKYFINKNGNT